MTEGEWRRLEDVGETLGAPLRARFGDDAILIFATPAGLRGVAERCPHADYSLVHADLLEDGALLRCTVKDEDGVLYARSKRT